MRRIILTALLVALSTTAHAQYAKTRAERDATWSQFSKEAVQASAAQNGGRPEIGRNCQPELKVCNLAVRVFASDGTALMLRETTDERGRLITRDICKFEKYGDIRVCRNFDTGVSIREMKDDKDNWYTVGNK